MNIYIQMGIGLLPAAVFVIFLVFKRRIFNAQAILSSLIVTICTVGLLAFGGNQMVRDYKALEAFNQEEVLQLAHTLYLEGAYTQSLDVLEDYSASFGYDLESRRLAARLYATEGDYVRSGGLYAFLEEQEAVEPKELEAFDDLVDLNQMQPSDERVPSYIKTVNQIIKGAYDDKNATFSDFAKSVTTLDETYAHFISGNPLDEDALEDIQDDFSTLADEEPRLEKLPMFSNARLRTDVLIGDYEAVVENISENASYHELMIASELLMGELVDDRDFPEIFQRVDRSAVRTIEQVVTEIERRNIVDLSIQEGDQLESRVNAIKMELESPVLSKLKRMLIQEAAVHTQGDTTKVFLELAKIEKFLENETTSHTYLNKAIYSSQESSDPNYASAMGQLMKVIDNDGSDTQEGIKQVSRYVEVILDNALTIDVANILSSGQTDGSEDSNTAQESTQTAVFEQSMVDFVSQTKTAITVNAIDTSGFEKIKARVKISSAYKGDIDRLRSQLQVYDCGAEITDFSIKKVTYDAANFLLVCDVSGSMGSSIQNLQDAVSMFFADRNKRENIGLITFNDDIVQSLPIGSEDSSLQALANQMVAGGGTDMFSALKVALEGYQAGVSDNNVIILMTDGQDGNPRDAFTISSEIGELANAKGITVYTMGLGAEVDTAYLSTIANSGNGDFIYVSDSTSLATFYDMLHGQVNDVYEIEYTAVDTMTTMGRTLEVVFDAQNLRGFRSYNLENQSDLAEGSGSSNTKDLSVSGLSVRTIYKGTQDIPLKLMGSGFDKSYLAHAKLEGKIDYNLKLTYVDENRYTLTIPASIAVGLYDVNVSINGKRILLKNGLTVLVQGEEVETVFGDYAFTSLERIDLGVDGVLLKGAVTLNKWLKFKGDVLITGDIKTGGAISVNDPNGSYVTFDKKTAEGLGKFLASKDIALDLPALNTFNLYHDTANIYNQSEYMVDQIRVGVLKLYDVMMIDSPVFKLYPGHFEVNYHALNTILPFQNKIFDAKGIKKPLFNFDFDGSGVINSENIGIKAELKLNNNYGDDYRQINLFNAPVYLNLDELELKVDTLKNDYEIGAMIKIALLDVGVGAELAWRDLSLDAFTLHLDKPFMGQWGPLPVTYSAFSFGADQIKDAVAKNAFKAIRLKGGLTIATGKVADYVPKMKKFIGDISLLSLPDTSFQVGVSPFNFEAEAELKFLDAVTLAQADVKLGTFDFSHGLLGIDSTSVSGLQAALKAGVMWNPSKHVSFEVSGKGTLDGHSKFVGVSYEGKGVMTFDWWLFDTKVKEEGTIILGMMFKEDNQPLFVLSIKHFDSKGKSIGKFYFIDFEGNTDYSEKGILK